MSSITRDDPDGESTTDVETTSGADAGTDAGAGDSTDAPTGTGLLDRLKQPEYTGENRCVPCTVVNVAIAAVVAGAVAAGAAVTAVGALAAGVLGSVLFAVFAGTIYLRGYLVPYTPTLTKRYFPDRVLALFDKAPGETTPETEEFEPVDVESTLVDLGTLTDCPDRNDLCLDPSFQRAWREEIDAIQSSQARSAHLADLLDVDESRNVDVREYGAAAVASVDGQQVGQWESDAAFVADLAADRVLRDRDQSGAWAEMDVLNRSRVLNGLRMFVERCPSCGAPVSVGQDTVESCCRTMDVVAVSCRSCDSRIFEVELTDDLEQQL